MKKINILVFLFCILCIAENTQAQFPCVRNISTNPNNPFNTEWGAMFPEDPGSFVNTQFNWYYLAPNITINRVLDGWTLPSSFPTAYGMTWPFDNSNGPGTNYLYGNISDAEKRDFHWEDGWELLWMNLGFLPNGDPSNPKAPNAWHPNPEYPNPDFAPYFVLYNRYRGTMRIFFNIWWFEQPYHNVTVSLQFSEISGTNNKISGILRHTDALDQALDKKSNITKAPKG